MTGIYGNSAEDRHFESALHDYLEGQDDTEHDEFIEQAVEEYLTGEYDPLNREHIEEAMANIDGGNLTVLAAHLSTAFVHNYDHHKEVLGRAFMGFVVDYWTKQATAQAEKDWENRDE